MKKKMDGRKMSVKKSTLANLTGAAKYGFLSALNLRVPWPLPTRSDCPVCPKDMHD